MPLLVSRLIFCLLPLLTFSSIAQDATHLAAEPGGISFFKGSWTEVLAEAKRQNKPVYVDIYTTWCPPCKRMAKEAFPNPKVGAKFNVHFINYQLDAERGEGVQIAKQYAVASYPTALYIDPNGTLVHRAVGYPGINGMIDQADHMLALSQLRTTVAKGDRDYVEGKRDPDFLKKYLISLQALNRPIDDVLDAYLDALPEPERATNETIAYLAEKLQSSTTKSFDFLIKNRPSILSSDPAKRNLATPVYRALYRALSNDFKQAELTNDEALLEKVIVNNERNTVSGNPFFVRQEAQKQEAANDYRLKFFRQTKNFAKYRELAGPIAQNQLMSQPLDSLRKLDSTTALRVKTMMVIIPDSIRTKIAAIDQPANDRLMSWKVSHSLHEIADTYRELGTSAADWEQALAWTERSIALYSAPAYLATYKALQKKLGRHD
ncbi:thioredoxin family protein [Spirosoma foliorum]|uniref:Thioredoxin family protein n=1 Tax=Spirosoma foliorum TaxID=2710596 RepID=A0A7G5GQ05_9BACT|nr:thioredoxin family protein [Spirosoma foliorum]QMW00947.1 thioredoxin family protein [Spirosoma foliorum]